MPVHPMMPAVINRGTILGIKEQIKIGKDLNKKIIQIAINKKAQKIDSPKPFTIKLLPSKNVTLLPVITTLYLAVSKMAIEALSIFCNNGGSLALPMSFIFTLILVWRLAESMNLFNSCAGLFPVGFTPSFGAALAK